MAELLKAYEFKLDSIGLIPSDGGKFEVRLGEQLVYSKLHTGRHLEPGEIVRLVDEHI
jgi:selT/selW/selH-like putative selenoprotein